MLRSVWASDSVRARRLLGAALAVLVVSRVLLGPLFATAAMPGLVALCAGGELVWVSAAEVDPARPDLPRDPCPWLGLSAAPAPPPVPLPLPRLVPLPALGGTTAADTLHVPPQPHAPQAPRAPPLAPPA